MEVKEIIIRLGLALVFSAVIGLEREVKHRPAGLKTHVIVCLGATIIALIQQQITYEVLMSNNANLSSDPARLIAQCISGIGFLGAGTIIVTNRNVSGLTTAASLWMTACLGIAVGMGFYEISIIGFISILIALIGLQQLLLFQFSSRLEVKYLHRETKLYINEFFLENKIKVKDVNYRVEFFEGHRLYTTIYEIDLPHKVSTASVIDNLTAHENIISIQLVNA